MENSEKWRYPVEILKLKTSRPFFSSIYRRFILRKDLLFFKVLSVYLLPFSLFYLAVIYLKKCLVRKRKLEVPVISVGNITTGGTGKTSLVMYIATFYQRYGRRIIIASSGAVKYRRRCFKTELEDEPLMVKKNFPEVATTGKSIKEIRRELTGDKKDIVVIDDGFHCHHIDKDMDILVIDMANPFDNNLLLPSGCLREPKSELERADIFILSHPYMVRTEEQKLLIHYLESFAKPIFIMDYKVESIENNRERISPEFIRGRNILAFTGTGNPFNFFSLLSTLSPSKVYGVIYPDHFHYQRQDIEELEDVFLEKGGEYLITTEKDYVKLSGYAWKVPIFYLRIKPDLKSINGEGFDTLLYSIIK